MFVASCAGTVDSASGWCTEASSSCCVTLSSPLFGRLEACPSVHVCGSSTVPLVVLLGDIVDVDWGVQDWGGGDGSAGGEDCV